MSYRLDTNDVTSNTNSIVFALLQLQVSNANLCSTCRRHVGEMFSWHDIFTEFEMATQCRPTSVAAVTNQTGESRVRSVCLSLHVRTVLTALEPAATTALNKTHWQWDLSPRPLSLAHSKPTTSYRGPPHTSPPSYHPCKVYGWLLCQNLLSFACNVPFLFPIIIPC